jgi:hypothetical protein
MYCFMDSDWFTWRCNCYLWQLVLKTSATDGGTGSSSWVKKTTVFPLQYFQSNSVDCGVFTIGAAFHIAIGDITTLVWLQENARAFTPLLWSAVHMSRRKKPISTITVFILLAHTFFTQCGLQQMQFQGHSQPSIIGGSYSQLKWVWLAYHI